MNNLRPPRIIPEPLFDPVECVSMLVMGFGVLLIAVPLGIILGDVVR